jgi:hypothetical protein
MKLISCRHTFPMANPIDTTHDVERLIGFGFKFCWAIPFEYEISTSNYIDNRMVSIGIINAHLIINSSGK